MVTPEGRFKADFRQELKKLGFTAVLQYKQDATTVQGFPDTIALAPESVVFFIEFKKSKNAKYRPRQKWWGERLTERGFFHYFVYPENKDEVLREIKEILG